MNTLSAHLPLTALLSLQEDQELSLLPQDYSLLTDLYQLTMAACYTGEGLEQKQACFEVFVRKLPEGFGYLIAMGLAQALDYLEKFHFSTDHIQKLRSLDVFSHVPEQFWTLLENGRFTGDVWAVPEGTAIFANEPMLRIEAPFWQAQIVETYLLNTLNYQTLVATRAARMRDIAGEKAKLFEFGTRRAFSPQASMWAARAALASGFNSTSNVLAALKLNRQPTGTMAHALVMGISALEGSEDDSFKAFHRYFPGGTLLIDTYNTVEAAQRLAERMKQEDLELKGVRIDSGDLVELSQKVRSLLPEVAIFASGDIDEFEIARLQTAGAEIDGYGIGTKLVSGNPVNGVYKLVEIDGIPVMKESSQKVTYPGRKQIFRNIEGGMILNDILGLGEEEQTNYLPLLQCVMKEGKRVQAGESLNAIAQRTRESVASLPLETRRLENPQSIQVEASQKLQHLTEQTRHHPIP